MRTRDRHQRIRYPLAQRKSLTWLGFLHHVAIMLRLRLLAPAGTRIAELEKGFAVKLKVKKFKIEKPPLPPDEGRERIIKGLKTRVRNLTAELHYTREWGGGKSANQFRIAQHATVENIPSAFD
jgi:hypothetical protein